VLNEKKPRGGIQLSIDRSSKCTTNTYINTHSINTHRGRKRGLLGGRLPATDSRTAARSRTEREEVGVCRHDACIMYARDQIDRVETPALVGWLVCGVESNRIESNDPNPSKRLHVCVFLVDTNVRPGASNLLALALKTHGSIGLHHRIAATGLTPPHTNQSNTNRQAGRQAAVMATPGSAGSPGSRQGLVTITLDEQQQQQQGAGGGVSKCMHICINRGSRGPNHRSHPPTIATAAQQPKPTAAAVPARAFQRAGQ
jgi:hypothetical protein